MKMVKGFFLERTGCFSSNNSSLVERLEIKTEKFRKKYFETLEQKYIVLREMFFYCYLFQSTKQRWKRKAP